MSSLSHLLWVGGVLCLEELPRTVQQSQLSLRDFYPLLHSSNDAQHLVVLLDCKFISKSRLAALDLLLAKRLRFSYMRYSAVVLRGDLLQSYLNFGLSSGALVLQLLQDATHVV
jgi:hypothetical protein